MSPTSLVAETVMRLMKQRKQPRSEDHLRGLATVFMTRVLVDSARARRATRRGGWNAARSLNGHTAELQCSLHSDSGATPSANGSPIDHDKLLQEMCELAEEMPRQMEVVTLHVLAEIPLRRVAKMVEVGERTAYRDLNDGLSALARRLEPGPRKPR